MPNLQQTSLLSNNCTYESSVNFVMGHFCRIYQLILLVTWLKDLQGRCQMENNINFYLYCEISMHKKHGHNLMQYNGSQLISHRSRVGTTRAHCNTGPRPNRPTKSYLVHARKVIPTKFYQV